MTQNVILSQKELKELCQLCSDPMLELGSMVRPEHLRCLQSQQAKRKVKVILKFPTDQAAAKWNDFHERQIRYGGHLVTAALTALVAASTAGVGTGIALGTAVGTTAAIVKDEVQAKFWYPKVARGWTLTREYNITYQQFPHQWFEVAWKDKITDHMGRTQDERSHGTTRMLVGGPNNLPEKVARDLVTRPSDMITKVMK